jgi:recombinational DNA repair protein (RecF pathway)
LEVSTSLASVRINGAGCRPCGLKKSAGSRRTGEKEAVQFMNQAGAIPLEPYQGSKKPWLCKCKKCKREIRPTYGNVKNNRTHPCVYCSKKKVHPDDAVKLMRDAGLEPLEPYPGSNSKWKCKHLNCGAIVYPAYSWIVSGQGGCLKCGYAENKRKQMTPEDEAIAFFKSRGFTPLVPYPGGNKPWKSKCSKCGEISAPHYSRVKSGTGCGVCAQRIVVPSVAEKVMREALLLPLIPYPGGKSSWKSKCLRCNREVFPKYSDIRNGDGGCKYCGGHFVEPEAAVALMLAANIKPLEPYKDSGTKWKSQCLVCKKSINPTYNSVQQRGSACKYCAKKFIDPDDAISVMRNAKLEPLVSYPGSQKPWLCKCLRCGRQVQPAYTTIQGGQKGCVYCGGKKVDPDEAFRLMISAGLTPLETYDRADKPWKCTCNKCKKLVTPTYTSIRVGQGGCRYCTNKGIDYNEPAYLYLMTHQQLGAHKVGIANYKTRVNRVKEHQKFGWELFQSRDYETGDEAFQVEQQVLEWLRIKKGLAIYLSKEQLPQGGYSETVDAMEIDLPTIWVKVEKLSKVKKES